MAFEFDLNTVPMTKGAEDFEQQTDSSDEVVVSQPIFENMKNHTSSDEVINQAIGDEELEPEEGTCFGTLEDVRAYYYRYARWIPHIPCKGIQEKENSGLNKLQSSLLCSIRQDDRVVKDFSSRDKEQKELECDAADLREIIPCVSSSPIEKYQVVYCLQSSEVQCDCFMFQSDGILCCHILAVLLHFRVTTLSSQYILSRWSKNVSRRHTYIRSSLDMDRSDDNMIIFRKLCSHFYNVAQDFVATPEVAATLRDAMDSARHKFKEHKESEHQAAHVPIAINSHTRDECPVSMNELQGPRRVPMQGHPTSTRLGADLNKSLKKRARKHKNTHNHNKGPNGNAQPSPTNVASSYKNT
ncbi:hypothetical protein Ahy_B03g065787 [Arachis hypogaea]|uniref:Protein FAR1-RELATED SEQUENCE n=1 Tax=Arachis hypogaea TaxID=3818 RepID=A0A445A2M2_ARAHY|nr:hypothetical protein Ahy_B03g065787 [Arachis hypogaea]